MRVLYISEEDNIFGGYGEVFIVPTKLRVPKSIFMGKCDGNVDKFISFIHSTGHRTLKEMLTKENEGYVFLPMYLKFNGLSDFRPRVKVLTKNQVKRKIRYEYRTGILINPDEIREDDINWYREFEYGTNTQDPDLTPKIWDYGVIEIPELPEFYTKTMDDYEGRLMTDKIVHLLCDEE